VGKTNGMLNHSEKIYVDSSAFYALLDRSDPHHKEASTLWKVLLHDDVTLITSNYVVAETAKLLQDKIGFEAARLWNRDILGILDVCWVDATMHQHAYELWLNLGRMRLSLIDCVSLVTMHHHQIEKIFCFKPHFTEHGFDLLSANGHLII
jgi:predicted nucleic acid-binding protein